MSAGLFIQFLHVQPKAGERAAWHERDPYPWDEVFDLLDAIPVEKRQKPVSSMFEPLTFECSTVGAHRVLSVHRVDIARTQTASHQGAVSRTRYGGDEGPTAASHLLLLDDQIAALARESGGPGPAQVAAYLAVHIGLEYEPNLVAVKRTDYHARLREMTGKSSVTLNMATSEIGRLGQSSSFAQAFQAAEEAVRCDEIEITFRVRRPKPAKERWFRLQRRQLERLLDDDGALAALNEAKAGSARLLEEAVTETAYVRNARGAIDPEVVVAEVLEKYGSNRFEIFTTLGLSPPEEAR